MDSNNAYNPRPRRMTLAPLRNVAFRRIWMSLQIFYLGWFVQTIAITSLMIKISSSDIMIALVPATTTSPPLFLSIIAGAVADNFGRRLLMLAGLCLIAIASILLALSVTMDFATPWLVLGLSFLAGCGIAVYEPGWHASVGDLFEESDIQTAVTLVSVGFNISRSIAPALGGAILALLFPLAAFGVSATCTVTAIWAVWRNKWPTRSSPLPPERIATAIHNGLRFAALTSDLRALMIRAFLFGLAASSILALLPLVAQDRAAGDPIVLGILWTAFGTGACMAGLSSGGLRISLPGELLTALASIACAVCCLALALTSSVIVGTIALAIGGGGWLITWSGFDGWVQKASPRWVLGRLYSIYYTVLCGSLAAGSWFWGFVAEAHTLHFAFIWAAVALLIVAAIGFLFPAHLPAVGDHCCSATPALGFPLDLALGSGPIIVRTEYLIERTKRMPPHNSIKVMDRGRLDDQE
ncbi:MFS transporter [Rhizobium laguerreae]|uniref:MFS transporter n=1 Tax=Rhizobium laguerreae TaxID=1076926 RepID=UPI001C91077D|nr:MFS transporter [Rhizobium laguerreae]MBY3122485.1 MFS transporter [Rhizobium laguerreae]